MKGGLFISKPPKKRKINVVKIIVNFVIVIVLLVGIGLISYPTVSNWYNQTHQSAAIAAHKEAVNTVDPTIIAKAREDAMKYNVSLVGKNTRFIISEEDHTLYNSLLNVAGDGIMGYIDIPKVDIHLAIYHGTEEEALQIGVGHLEGSSLPIGGVGTHCLLSGHRGLPSAKLFTRIDELVEGDIFYIYSLTETLAYQVDDISVVLPDTLSDITIDPTQDYVTLITCTPYGVNSHRLLVRGTRIPVPEGQITTTTGGFNFSDIRIGGMHISGKFVWIPICILFIIILEIIRRRIRNYH